MVTPSIIYANIKDMFRARNYTEIDYEKNPKYIIAKDTYGRHVYAFREIFETINNAVNNDIMQTLISISPDFHKHAIIIYSNSLTPTVANTILPKEIRVDLSSKEITFDIERFHSIDVSFNPTKHELVSPHRRLSDAEIMELKLTPGTYLVDGNGKGRFCIPHILGNDAMVLYYNFKPGNIIEIKRKNELPVYRQVVGGTKN